MVPACLSVTHPLLLLLPPPSLLVEAGPLLWTHQLVVGYLYPISPVILSPCGFFLFLSFALSLLSPRSLPLTFTSPFPPVSHRTSPTLILLYGGFAVGSPRHEWSISRSPSSSSPYNSVQWAWIVSQSTQENLSENTVILWADSLQCKTVCCFEPAILNFSVQ